MTSSRSKKAGKTKRAALWTLLFVNLIAPIILLVVDKSLPDGLFGRKASVANEIRQSVRNTSRSVLGEEAKIVKRLSGKRDNKAAQKEQNIPMAEPDVAFSNKGDGNKIKNTQEATNGKGGTSFKNEGNNNEIINVQNSK